MENFYCHAHTYSKIGYSNFKVFMLIFVDVCETFHITLKSHGDRLWMYVGEATAELFNKNHIVICAHISYVYMFYIHNVLFLVKLYVCALTLKIPWHTVMLLLTVKCG